MSLLVVLGGFLIILLTSFTHSIFTMVVTYQMHKRLNSRIRSKMWLVNKVILLIVLFTIFESLFWAIYYFYVDAFSSLEESLYFSLVTFSTLGYGDVILKPEYRLLGGLEAANGIIIFGWSTAVVVGVIQKLHVERKHA